MSAPTPRRFGPGPTLCVLVFAQSVAGIALARWSDVVWLRTTALALGLISTILAVLVLAALRLKDRDLPDDPFWDDRRGVEPKADKDGAP